jgi:hypothetical protein
VEKKRQRLDKWEQKFGGDKNKWTKKKKTGAKER